MAFIDVLYERERLKMQILADMPKIPAFIMNSYQLWGASQFGTKTPEKVFYGTGSLMDVLGRLLARKSCMAAWRQTKIDGHTLRLIEPMATVLGYSRAIASQLQDLFGSATPYDALIEFQTSGYENPLTAIDLDKLVRKVESLQHQEVEDLPPVSDEVMRKLIYGLCDLARVDRDKVEIYDHVAHPACLGYGGMAKGIILGLTYKYEDPIIGILTNWHEIGHAVYRQAIPHGSMVHGRAMDESVAFLYEHVVGRSDQFLNYLLDAGLRDCGYTLELLREHVRRVDRETKRIETNALRHVIDIHICDQYERAMINEEIEAEDAELYWGELIAPYQSILPDDYPFYWDVHQMTGIYGDRACYNPGILGAFQIGAAHKVDLNNIYDVVTDMIAPCVETRFDKTMKAVTSNALSTKDFMTWAHTFYS